jgi:hypothetical protein
MKKSKRFLFLALLGWVLGFGDAATNPARADACPWGGGEARSIRCFDCMKRVWSGSPMDHKKRL